MRTREAKRLKLSVIEDSLSICRLLPSHEVPDWATQGSFYSVTQTEDELSVVCASEWVPAGVRSESDWRAFKIAGPLDFSLTGVLASLAVPLAAAGVSIFVVSTFETDYVLVQEEKLSQAVSVLEQAGHDVEIAA